MNSIDLALKVEHQLTKHFHAFTAYSENKTKTEGPELYLRAHIPYTMHGSIRCTHLRKTTKYTAHLVVQMVKNWIWVMNMSKEGIRERQDICQ